jgi:hypothetical protein
MSTFKQIDQVINQMIEDDLRISEMVSLLVEDYDLTREFAADLIEAAYYRRANKAWSNM